MSIANEITKAQNNLKDCYDVCKSVDGVVLPDDKNFDNLPALIEQALNPFQKPSDWSDIRLDCPANSIALYAAHADDFSSYDNLGFTATCTGGYKVYIDGTVYGSYASDSTCNITWSSLALDTGDDITTPSALTAHKIWIEPATEGTNITAFRCARVANSGTEEQGVLWSHFNISNAINLQSLTDDTLKVSQNLCEAITATNNIIKFVARGTGWLTRAASNITYLPTLDCDNTETFFNYLAYQTKLKTITIKNANVKYCDATFAYSTGIESLKFTNVDTSTCNNFDSMFRDCRSLKKLPEGLNFSAATSMQIFLTNAVSLEDTVLDVSSATGLTRIGCYGTSQYFMSGFKGLRVSNEAPFTGSAPQINVSYTGMDRAALVQLFNDLPYNVGYEVVGSPTIDNGVVSGFTTSDYTNTSLSLSSDIEKMRIKIRFKTPETFVSGNTNILTFGTPLTNDNSIRIYTGTVVSRVVVFGKDINIGTSALQANTWYKVDITIDGSVQNSLLYSDDDAKLAEAENKTFTSFLNGYGYFGGRVANAIQAIDFNNTSIEKNDIYWFRGQPVMTKTLSCVGATGTADLTADDKDIALNKGWSLTLS